MRQSTLLTALFVFCLVQSSMAADDSGCICPVRISSPVTIQKIKDAIRCCKLEHVEQVLPLLPEEFRSRYVLVYDSRSRQKSDPMHPRIIFFGLDAKMIVAVGGNPALDGFAGLEMIQFDDGKRKFLDPVEIFFPKDKFPHATNTMPQEVPKATCNGCHRELARTNWDPYDGWPGVYGSADGMPAVEEKKFNEFWAEKIEKKSGRYQYFTDPTQHSDKSGFRDYYPSRPNLQFTLLLSRLNAQANAHMIGQNEDLKQFRYALLAALDCFDEPIEEFIPDKLEADFPYKYSEILKDTKKRLVSSLNSRISRQCDGLKKLNNDVAVPEKDCQLPMRERSLAFLTARLRYIMENRGICWDLEQGSMEFRHQFFSFNTAVYKVGGLDLYLWKELLDPVSDARLYSIYQKAWDNRMKDPDGQMFIANEDWEPLCTMLKGKSNPNLQDFFQLNMQ